jgi:hypothetical protein
MLLGATLAEETLTIQNALAAAIILTSVVITTTRGTKPSVVRQTEKSNDQQNSNCA